MPRQYAAPQTFSTNTRPAIALTPVTSNQVKAIGYCPDTQTLAVSFTRGAGAIYHYPQVSPETHAAFVGAESIGKFFSANIQALPFEKFPAEPEPETTAA